MAVRGWVYVLSNVAMPGLVKIGFSTKDPNLRADELDGTGLPHPYVVEYDALVVDPRDVEQSVHAHLQSVHERKEFFRTTVLNAVQVIRSVAAAQKKEILAESQFLFMQPENMGSGVSKESSYNIVHCPYCKTENKVLGNRFVCTQCRKLQSFKVVDDAQPENMGSGVSKESSYNIVHCPYCKTENKVLGNRFVCTQCRKLQSFKVVDDAFDKKKTASRNRIFMAK